LPMPNAGHRMPNYNFKFNMPGRHNFLDASPFSHSHFPFPAAGKLVHV